MPGCGCGTAAFLAAIHTALDGAQPAARRPAASSPAPADASWFTEECRQLRREYLRQLYRHPNSRACREARRAYKACVRRCKRAAAAEAADLLKHLLSGNPRQFWQLVKGKSARKAVQGTLRGWQEYIKHLMGQQMPTATDQHGQWPVAGVPSSNTLNEPFSREELDAVLQQLKCNKAADLQGLRAEQLKEPPNRSDAATGSTEDGTADVQQVFAEPLLHL